MSDSRIEKLRLKKAKLYMGGGEERIAKQHAAGKRTARERLAQLFDEDTFQETHPFMQHRCVDFDMQDKELPGEGVVTGYGLVDGRPLYAVSQDFTVAGGAVGEATARKISNLQDDALKTGDPIIFINDSGGARIQARCRVTGRLRRHLLSQYQVFRGGAPDQHHQRALRRRRGLFSGPDGFHHPGAARGPDVHHRAECHQAGHRGGRDGRAAGRCRKSFALFGRGALRRRKRGRRTRDRQAPAVVSAQQQHRRPALSRGHARGNGGAGRSDE